MTAPKRPAGRKGAARRTTRRTRKKKPAQTRTDMLRDRLAARLPDMLDAAIAAYQRIAGQDGGEDPKRFAAAQSGAKAALAHIEQLIALAEVVIRDAPASRAEETAAAERLVAEARAALAAGSDEDAADDADASVEADPPDEPEDGR